MVLVEHIASEIAGEQMVERSIVTVWSLPPMIIEAGLDVLYLASSVLRSCSASASP